MLNGGMVEDREDKGAEVSPLRKVDPPPRDQLPSWREEISMMFIT